MCFGDIYQNECVVKHGASTCTVHSSGELLRIPDDLKEVGVWGSLNAEEVLTSFNTLKSIIFRERDRTPLTFLNMGNVMLTFKMGLYRQKYFSVLLLLLSFEDLSSRFQWN